VKNGKLGEYFFGGKFPKMHSTECDNSAYNSSVFLLAPLADYL